MTNLTAGEVIAFNLLFFLDTGYGPTSFLLRIGDSIGVPIAPQPTGFGFATPITFNTTITYTWTVPTSGNYLFAGYSSGTFQSLVPYYINITNSNGNAISPRVGIIRSNYLFKHIYISNTTDSTITCTSCGIFVLRNYLDPVNFKIGGTISPSSSTSNSKTYTALAAGYYFI